MRGRITATQDGFDLKLINIISEMGDTLLNMSHLL